MDLQQLLNSITPQIYKQLQRAIEIGKWPDGRALTAEQRSLCMQAIIAYDQRKPEHERTGYVEPKKPDCVPKANEQPVKWKS
jgi:uncharacterized protein YeaC (DUF1315 family)